MFGDIFATIVIEDISKKSNVQLMNNDAYKTVIVVVVYAKGMD